MAEPMKVDKVATAKARARHTAGIVKLQKLFRVTPARIEAALRPYPKKRKTTNGDRVRRRRFDAKRRTTMRCFGEFEKKTGATVEHD